MFGKGSENRAKKENSLSLRSWMGEEGRMKCEVKGATIEADELVNRPACTL